MVTAGCARRHREDFEASENLGQKLTGFIMATLVHPQQNPLDFNVLGTQKGPWLIRVNTVISEEKGANVSLQLVLHRLHEENPDQTRRLYAVVPVSDLEIPQERVL